MLPGLFVNFCILVSLTFVMSYALHIRLTPDNDWRRRVAGWLTLSACGLVLMQFPVSLGKGVLVDLRSVIPALAGFGGGWLSSLPVAAVLAGYRYWLGGAGAVAGVVSILGAAVLGWLSGLVCKPLTAPMTKLTACSLGVFTLGNLSLLLAARIGALEFWRVYPITVPFYALGLLVCLGIFRTHYQADQHLAEMGRLAHRDHLTNLLNMRSFESLVTESMRCGDAYLLLFDLDRFKQVNDTFGHEAGNMVLTTMADLIRRQIRSNDVAFRYGGEEFAVLLRHCSPDQVVQVAERLRRAVAEYPFTLEDGRRIPVTISGGLVALQADQPIRQQVTEADMLMYRAKSCGRNRIEVAVGS